MIIGGIVSSIIKVYISLLVSLVVEVYRMTSLCFTFKFH